MKIIDSIKKFFKIKNNNKERIFPYLSDEELKQCNEYINEFENKKLTADELKYIHKIKTKKYTFDDTFDYPYDDTV